MKVLVTGAGGFLGVAVVSQLLRRGHDVRAMIRPAAQTGGLPWRCDAQIVRFDLRQCDDLPRACTDVDAIVHLAAGTSGSLESQLADSVVATERLLAALTPARKYKLVHCSTLSVYDWQRPWFRLDERSPLETQLYQRDSYAVAKTWQERVVRRWADRHGWPLTVLRPGYIWGPGRPWIDGAGLRLGRWHLINGPFRRLALTHVDNCADCIATATEDDAADGQTFNVIDSECVRAWRFSGDYLRRSRVAGRRVPVPYSFGLGLAHLTKLASRLLFGPGGRLPGVLDPIRHRARFRSLRWSDRHLRARLGWSSPFDYITCLGRTYPAHAPETATSESSRPELAGQAVRLPKTV